MAAFPSTPLQERVDLILAAAGKRAPRRDRPALAVLVGLPGSGKTRVAEELHSRTGAVVLESDVLRRLLFPRPSYSAEESRSLFAAIHDALDDLLADGSSAILDATNLVEDERALLYRIADRRNARLVLAHVTAPAETIRNRLSRREWTDDSHSDADIGVYKRMRARMEEIRREHHVVDTSKETEAALKAIAEEMNEP